MSYVSDFLSWANSVFYTNTRRLITGTHANTLAHRVADYFVTKDSPLPNFPFSVEQADLDGNNSVVLTHGLGTIIPGLVIYDENDEKMGVSLCRCEPVDANNTRLTFYDVIPAIGNGAYRGYLFFMVADVALPYQPNPADIFTEDFDTWEGAGYEVVPFLWAWEIPAEYEYPTADFHFVNNSNRLEIYNDISGTIGALCNVSFQIKRYRIQITLVSGSLLMVVNGRQNFVFTTAGQNQLDFLPEAIGSDRRLLFYTYNCTDVIIDNITLTPLE